MWVQDYSVATIAFVAGWILYFLSHYVSKFLFRSYSDLKPAVQVDWCSRIVSNINAVVATYGALTVLATKDFDKFPLTAWNEDGGFYIQILLGYFAYDFILILANKELQSVGTIVHHILGLLNYGLVCISGQEQYLALLWMATELTTPFVNMRWFLAVTKQSHTMLYTINGLAMTLAFLCWRVIYIPTKAFYTLYYFSDHFYLLYPYMQPSIPLSIPAITLLNIYWTSLMIRGIISVLMGKKKRKGGEGNETQGKSNVGRVKEGVKVDSRGEGEVRRRGA
eukprot:Phypoly_transcript_14165.p1 GENE.Phypoly_transcript_14165~~Phypoly_transcript_14165.p1  ORF type:complete len:280 (+),score=33.17 Phypoly_transcript_14165:127-966(+)